jgi:hypothetical protein
MYPRDDMLALFVGAVAIAALGLGMSFFGPDPQDATAPTQPTPSPD